MESALHYPSVVCNDSRAEVCAILFSTERNKNSFALVTVHKDEMENNDPFPKGQHFWRQWKQKGSARYCRVRLRLLAISRLHTNIHRKCKQERKSIDIQLANQPCEKRGKQLNSVAAHTVSLHACVMEWQSLMEDSVSCYLGAVAMSLDICVPKQIYYYGGQWYNQTKVVIFF